MDDATPADPIEDAMRDLHAKLSRERDVILLKLRAVDTNLDRLGKAASVLGVTMGPAPKPQGEGGSGTGDANDAFHEPKPRTMKQAAVAILRTENRPMTTVEMLPLINKLLGTSYERGSLSPQLSRLAQDRVITRDEDRWSLL